MFVYKYCPKCKTRNHKANNHCVRCGDELTTAEKFGKDVFAIILTSIILFSSASVFASKSYFDSKNKAEQPKVEQPVAEPGTTEQAPEATTQPAATSTQPTTTKPKTTATTTTPKNTTTAEILKLEQEIAASKSRETQELSESKRKQAESKIDYYNTLMTNDRRYIQEDMDRKTECIKGTQQWIGTDIFNSQMAICDRIQVSINKYQAEIIEYQKQADFWLSQKMSY